MLELTKVINELKDVLIQQVKPSWQLPFCLMFLISTIPYLQRFFCVCMHVYRWRKHLSSETPSLSARPVVRHYDEQDMRDMHEFVDADIQIRNPNKTFSVSTNIHGNVSNKYSSHDFKVTKAEADLKQECNRGVFNYRLSWMLPTTP